MAAAIDAAQTLAEVEDLYRPYKPKRRTRATVAKEKGLGAARGAALRAGARLPPTGTDAAAAYIDAEKGVETLANALQGANDIIAEWISDDAAVRRSLRELLEKRGGLCSLAATEEVQRLPPVLRFRAAAQPSPGAPDPRHQPRREGENAQRDRPA